MGFFFLNFFYLCVYMWGGRAFLYVPVNAAACRDQKKMVAPTVLVL